MNDGHDMDLFLVKFPLSNAMAIPPCQVWNIAGGIKKKKELFPDAESNFFLNAGEIVSVHGGTSCKCIHKRKIKRQKTEEG